MKMWVKKMDKHGMHLLHRGETVETAVPSQPTGSMGVSRKLWKPGSCSRGSVSCSQSGLVRSIERRANQLI